MEDPRIRKLARFLIRGAVELQKDEKILIELHGSETRGPTRPTWPRSPPMNSSA